MKFLSSVARLLISAGFTLLAANATAHTSATSFVSVEALDASNVRVSIDVSVRDLHYLLDLDTDRDATISWRELTQSTAAIDSLVFDRTRVHDDQAPCIVVGSDALALADHGDGPYAHVTRRFSCAGAAAALAIDYRGWFDADPRHLALLEYSDANGRSTQSVLSNSATQWQVAAGPLARAIRFFEEGMRHLVTGYDHMAFLGVLLLALVRREPASTPAPLRSIFRRAFIVITSFTLAHSCTLLLAASGVLLLPMQPVEIVIAVSVLLAALLNLTPAASRHGWKLAFGFGLIHGLGFAGALAELSSERLDFIALGAFNVGIEVAQIACAAIAIPVMWLLFRPVRLQRIGVPVASLGVAALALTWVVGRV